MMCHCEERGEAISNANRKVNACPSSARGDCLARAARNDNGKVSMSWADFERAAPALAQFGSERLHARVAYLATTRADGAPRVHPVTPILGQGHLFLFMEPTSPKGKDLQRGSRYALHCAMNDSSGESGEFWCAGTARMVEDANLRARAAQSGYQPKDRYVLFELDVERAAATTYPHGEPIRQQWPWKKDAP
jgi:hypothetical protein